MITKFKLYENYMLSSDVDILKGKIVDIMRGSGYVVQYHDRIYSSTLIKRTDLYCTIFTEKNIKYNEEIYLNVLSFKEIKKPENYSSQYFYFPIELLYKLKTDDVINYVELPFLKDLLKIEDDFNLLKKIDEYEI